MRKEIVSKKISLCYLYTLIVLVLPFIIEYFKVYNFSSFGLHIYNSCFYISLFIILAIEDARMKNMLEKEYSD